MRTRTGNNEQVLQCIEAGATAYLFKDSVADCQAHGIHLRRKLHPGRTARIP